MNNTKKIGNNIKKFRELKGLTQENMALDLEMSQTGYGRIERGETDISLSRIESIAKVLGLTIYDIIDFDEKYFFNISNVNGSDTGVIHKSESDFDRERKLYEEQISLLKEQNQTLVNQLNFLQKLLEK